MERIAGNGLDAEKISGVHNIQNPEPSSVPTENAGMYKKRKMMEDLVAREHATNPKTLALARKGEEEYAKTMRQEKEKIAKRNEKVTTEKVTRQAPAYNKACLDEESLTAEEFSRKEAIILQKLRCKAREVRENN